MNGHLDVNWHLVLLLAFSVLQIAIGLAVGRMVKDAGDFFVAGRRLPAFLLFATVLAANIGAGSTVGAASLGYRDGLGAWWWNGSAGLGSLVLAFWAGPRLWRLARDNGYLTLGDFVESRYGRAVRGLSATLMLCATLTILAAQLIGVASILQVVAGQPRWVGALVGGVVITIYFVSGGLLSSAWVNLVQLVVKLIGFAVAAPLAVAAAGGLGAIASAPGLPADYFDFFHGGRSGIPLLALLGPAFVVSPGLVQKAYGAVSERAIRVGIGANGVALLLFGFLPPLIGIVARVLHPDLASNDLALPTVLVRDLPPAIGALGLAAIFAAELSAADAVLFMLATSSSRDIYKRFVRPSAPDRDVLRVARLAAVAASVAGVLLAVVFPTVIAALTVFYGLLTVLFFVPVVAALVSRRVGPPEALAGMGVGVGVLAAVHLGTAGAGLGGWRPDTIALVASACAFGAMWAVRRP
jgi:SSS family solute:Na+ symporter